MPLDPIAAIQTTLGINRTAAKLATGGFILLTLAISAWQLLGDRSVTIWQMLGALIGLIVLMMILSTLPLFVRRLCGWVVGICFSAWACTLTAQVIADGRLPIASARCIASFQMADTCSRTLAVAAAEITPEATITADAAAAPSLDLAPEAEESAPSEPTPPDGQTQARVFIQFAGFAREEVVALAASLTDQGWTVEGGDRGGERTGAAAGLRQVRYFNAGDQALAEALALAISAGLPGTPAIEVKDLSTGRYGTTNPGLLEVWISQ